MIVSFHELAERELNEAAECFTQRQPSEATTRILGGAVVMKRANASNDSLALAT
jgi:hypothetical protein